MKLRLLVASFVCLAVVSTALVAADKEDPLKGIKCVVSGGKINPEATADYKKGHVYFCCMNCPKAFAKDTKKFATKANHQLVATKQYEQKKCPLSGGKLNADTAIKVGTTKVAFCCENCQGKVAKAKDAEQLDLVFSDKAFKKAFQLVKKDDAK